MKNNTYRRLAHRDEWATWYARRARSFENNKLKLVTKQKNRTQNKKEALLWHY